MDAPNPNPSLRILEKIEEQITPDQQKLANYVAALRSELAQQEKSGAERDQLLAEYEAAYEKLTAPANKIGVYLRELENDLVLVAFGDTEYATQVDPNIDREKLETGVRVLFNDAYAVVGTLPPGNGGAVMKVSQSLEDGRLRVGGDPQNQQGRLIERSTILEKALIAAGDEVRLDGTGRIAIEHFAHKDAQDYFMEEVPNIPWEKIGGQKEAIEMIRETIEFPMLHPELYAKFDKKPIKGILLYGPPGCGKTLIGKAIAHNLAKEYSDRVGHEVKEYFMHISGPKILNMWLGETERIVREIFQTARAKAKEGFLVVIFMDEAESVLRTRSGGRYLNISNTVVPQFCAELDGLVSLENVVLVLTSNRPDYIDPAILRPERIDRKVKIIRPDKDSARDILSIYLHENLPIDPALLKEFDGEIECARRALVEATLNALWRKDKETEFLKVMYRNGSSTTLHWKDLVSGALIKSVVDRAKDIAIRRAIASASLHGAKGSKPGAEVAEGLRIADLTESLTAEYAENEIFPKSDVMEDWLKLLDIDPESIANVRPVKGNKGEEFVRKNVI